MAIAEYIDREQVLETLDYWDHEFSEIDHYIWRIKDDIKELTSTNMTLCQQCEFYIAHDKRCVVWNHGVFKNGYCSRGVKKHEL